VDVELLQSLLAQGVVPVISAARVSTATVRPIASNSDGVALAVAKELKAIKLIFITSQDGLIHGGQILRQVPVAELERLGPQRYPAGFRRGNAVKGTGHAVAACEIGRGRGCM